MAAQTLSKPKARRFRILPESKLERKEALWFWLFISPWAIGFLVFTFGPIVASAYLSLTRYSLSSSPVWVGFDNYQTLFGDRIFWKSLQVTAYYTVLAVPLGIILSLALAVLLNQKIVNYVIRSLIGPNGTIPLGVVPPKWLQDPNWTVPSVVVMGLWGFGGGMLVYLSALQGVPTHLYEAATIDGAGRIRQFFNITLPMISGVILFTFVTGVIGSFQVFTQAYILSGNGSGSPAYSLMFYVLYLFNNAFRTYRMGTAAAQAWILFLVVLVLTLLLFRFSRRFVYYESDEEGFL